MAESLLLPAVVENVADNIELRQRKTKFYYDRQAKCLPKLEVGQRVKLQPLVKGDAWKKARTVGKVGDRSYLVQTDEGKIYRRNRKFIRTVPNSRTIRQC